MQCGARLTPGARTCELCGFPTAAPHDDDADDLDPADAAFLAASGDPYVDDEGDEGDAYAEARGAAEGPGVFCNACRWENPPGARFCARCGAPLQAEALAMRGARPLRPALPSAATTVSAPAAPVGRTLGVVIGAAVALVAGLYLVTVASSGRAGNDGPLEEQASESTTGTLPGAGAGAANGPAAAPGAGPGAGPAQAGLPSIPADIERQVNALEGEIGRASGAEKARKQREAINLLLGVSRPDRAAELQEALATTENTAEAWRRAGDLFYQWMEALPEDGRAPVAARAITAYDRLLALDDADLDARARLGWAAQYGGGNPMRAITETNEVLKRDSVHLGATYNRGWFMMRIGRVEPAIAQFRKVQRIAGAESPLGREAENIIQTLQAQAGPDASQGTSPGAPAGAPTTAPPAGSGPRSQ